MGLILIQQFIILAKSQIGRNKKGAKTMRTAYTAEERLNVEACGIYEKEHENGEIWSYNGEQWYVSDLVMNESEFNTYICATEPLPTEWDMPDYWYNRRERDEWDDLWDDRAREVGAIRW